MRSLLARLVAIVSTLIAAPFYAQTCTGLCLQQVSCPAGATTSISGIVYAPNGVDPLPNIVVYIPNAAVEAFPAGVSCPVVGQPPSGSPLVGTTTAVDGSFTLANVPVGTNIPLVIQSGRWRRQVTVPATTSCVDTAFSTRFPQTQFEGDIPKFAVATGSQDNVECVLRKVGIQDSEFTNPSGTGRISIFSGSGSAGALIDSTTPSQDALMSDPATLNAYDVLMLPCQGRQFDQTSTALANFIQFANAGGRVYASHFSYVWMYDNPPFDTVANWATSTKAQNIPDGIATVDTSFGEGQTLSAWLQLTGASTAPGQIAISTLKHDFNGVNAPNQSWLTLNNASFDNPVMQFVFNTPFPKAANQCGRVLFNEYHVETRTASTTGVAFPTECNAGAMTPQEKLLEFSLFELTDDGGVATLTPTSQDFGSISVGFPAAPQTFVWTNNSSFPASVSNVTATGDFAVTSNNCSSVAAGASCQISAVFTPTALGARTGVLTVGTSANSLTSSLTGTGIVDIAISSNSMNFGSLDVGASATRSLTLTNTAPGPVALPIALTSGAFSETSTCPAVLPANATCSLAVTFTALTTGPNSGSLTMSSGTPANLGFPVALLGNGVDFSIASSPSSASVIAGIPMTMKTITTPIAGFAANISLTCTTTAPASTCTSAATSFTPVSTVTTPVTITTTAQYTVVGYGGFGAGNFLLWCAAAASSLLLWHSRRRIRQPLRVTIAVVLSVLSLFTIAGCSGKLPAMNSPYTSPGTYTYTLTATDGFLTHSTTYSLQVTAK